MKTTENAMMEAYVAPQVEVIEVEVEKGFALSPGDVPDYPNGGNPF